MKKKNMLKVADAIEKRQVAGKRIGFNMRNYYNDGWGFGSQSPRDANGSACGTTACVAGFALLLYISESDVAEYLSPKTPQAHDIGRAYLGLSERQAKSLFLNAISDFNENNPLVPDALRWMALTGKVDWRKAITVAQCVQDQAI